MARSKVATKRTKKKTTKKRARKKETIREAEQANTSRGRGRPKKTQSQRLGQQVALRLKSDLTEKLDAKMQELVSKQPGVVWTRAQVVRHILYEALSDY